MHQFLKARVVPQWVEARFHGKDDHRPIMVLIGLLHVPHGYVFLIESDVDYDSFAAVESVIRPEREAILAIEPVPALPAVPWIASSLQSLN